MSPYLPEFSPWSVVGRTVASAFGRMSESAPELATLTFSVHRGRPSLLEHASFLGALTAYLSPQLQAEGDRCIRLSGRATNVTGIGMLSWDFIQP
jgi:hypothetical protein